MLKNTLLKCAQLLDRDDLIDALKNANTIDGITNKQIQNDITKLISYYNFIINMVYEDYLDISREDEFISDADRKIYFSNFLFKPTKVLSARSGERKEPFQIFSEYLLVSRANVRYKVEYKYLPDEVKDFCDCYHERLPINDDILVFGIISQYLASKGKYNESEYYNSKFMYKLFKVKCKKDRRLKSHFEI